MDIAELIDFIATSTTLQALDAQLADRSGGSITDDYETVQRILDDLANLDVTTIKQLDVLLTNTANDIPTLFTRLNAAWFTYKEQHTKIDGLLLPRGCAILYLTFLLAAKHTDETKLDVIEKYIARDAVTSATADLATPAVEPDKPTVTDDQSLAVAATAAATTTKRGR